MKQLMFNIEAIGIYSFKLTGYNLMKNCSFSIKRDKLLAKQHEFAYFICQFRYPKILESKF